MSNETKFQASKNEKPYIRIRRKDGYRHRLDSFPHNDEDNFTMGQTKNQPDISQNTTEDTIVNKNLTTEDDDLTNYTSNDYKYIYEPEYINSRVKLYKSFFGSNPVRLDPNWLLGQDLAQDVNDVPNYMLNAIRENIGMFFGKKRIWGRDFFVGKPQNHDGHIIVVGGAGSGKSTCIAMPTLETWGGAIFAIDIKGELTAHREKIREPKRPAKIFNLSREKGVFSTYDPFYFLRQDGDENLTQNAYELAQAIIPLPHDVRDPYWIQSAQNVLTAAILYYFDTGFSFNDTITEIQTTSLSKLITEIRDSNNSRAKMYINQFSDIEDFSDFRTLACISTELSNRIMVFATDPTIIDAFDPSGNNINWEDLRTHNIFMRISEDKLEQWGPVITLMLTQLIKTLERCPDRFSHGGNNMPPILLLLDEFPRLGKLNVIKDAIATLRSKGVCICLIIQSLAQLDATYGEYTRRIIMDNCQYKAILNVTDADSQKYFSDLVGSINVGKKGFSTNYDPYTGEVVGYSCQVNESREPIIYPEEFATLEDIVLLTPEGFCRVDKAPSYINEIE